MTGSQASANSLKTKEASFATLPLDEVAAALRTGLAENYAEVEVGVCECPDLQELGCAFSGINGSPFLIELGGEPYVHNPKYRDEGSFDLNEIMAACGRPEGKVLGAGFPSLVATGGRCGDLMPCLEMTGRSVSKLARVGPDKQCLVEDYPSRLHGGLGNLYVSDGLPGEVLSVEVRKRIGDEASLPLAMRSALMPLTGEGQLALGGVFNVLEGQVRAHVQPDFECIAFEYYDLEKDEVTRPDFLQYYDGMGPDLMCLSALWTGDPTNGELNLRPTGEHTHFFSTANRAEGGHYHYDVAPDVIHYRGYFQMAEKVVRVADIYAEISAHKQQV